MDNKVSNSEFYDQIKQESLIYSNIMFVLEKIEVEQQLSILTQTMKNIIEKEITFALVELKKIRVNFQSFDLNGQLIQNTLIFKENLKLITGSLSDLISRLHLVSHYQTREPARENQFSENLRNAFDPIKELDEEDFSRSQSINLTEPNCSDRTQGNNQNSSIQLPIETENILPPPEQQFKLPDQTNKPQSVDIQTRESFNKQDGSSSSKVDQLGMDFMSSTNKVSETIELEHERTKKPNTEHKTVETGKLVKSQSKKRKTKDVGLASKSMGCFIPFLRIRNVQKSLEIERQNSAEVDETRAKSKSKSKRRFTDGKKPNRGSTKIETEKLDLQMDHSNPQELGYPITAKESKRFSLYEMENGRTEPSNTGWVDKHSYQAKSGFSIMKEMFSKSKFIKKQDTSRSQSKKEVPSHPHEIQEVVRPFKKKPNNLVFVKEILKIPSDHTLAQKQRIKTLKKF